MSFTLPTVKPIFRIVPDITDKFSIYDVATDDVPISWEATFKRADPELELVSEVVENKEKTCGKMSMPPRRLLFEAFHNTRIENVKVVIIGQDPYYNGTAMGMAFSMGGDRRASPSLRNIYRELERSIPDFLPPGHGDLTEWTRQGVLLLNRALTVEPDLPKSHIGEWRGFIRKVIEDICEVNKYAVFMMWGKEAQGVEEIIGGKALKLMSPHPSPMNRRGGFIGNDHFKLANEHLITTGQGAIDWQLSS